MAENNENNPFVLGAKKDATTVSTPITETTNIESTTEISEGGNPFLLKKKDQTQLNQSVESTALNTPSQLDSAGSTSELAGSTSDALQKTETPFAISGEDLAAKTGGEVPIVPPPTRGELLLQSETQQPLDVTPDFNTPRILQNLQTANADMYKNELIQGGKTEEEADVDSKILFPEQDFQKSVELGINTDKVKKDYLTFLYNNDPEKFKDLQLQVKSTTFKGENSMSFMKDALLHQGEIIDTKMNAIISKGVDNITDQDISNIEALESQKSRLDNRLKNVINDYPEIRKKLIDEKLAQEAVDEDYKQAKAKALLPGFDGDAARANVLYNQVVAPIGRASVRMVGDLVNFAANEAKQLSPDEVTERGAEIVSDWATGYFDTEKSGSIFKTPTDLKGGLIENGDIKGEKLVPKVSETLFQMFGLLSGGATAGAALKTAGMSQKLSQGAGLIASSFALSQNGYYQEAKSLGLSNDEANNFANSASLVTSALELINPQSYIFGEGAKKGLTKFVVEAVKDGVSMKKAIKEGTKFMAKEVIAENRQELMQTAGDLGVKYLFNKKNQDDTFDLEVTQDEILEQVILTSIVTGIGSTKGIRSGNRLESESLYNAANNVDKFKEFITKPEVVEKMKPGELEAVTEKVAEYKKVVDGLPKNISEDKRIELADLVYNKKKLMDSKKDVIVDDVVTQKAGDEIQTQIDAINGQISMVFEEQKDTNLDTKLDNVSIQEKEGSVEYKVNDQFFSETEIIDRLNDDAFVKSVKDGEVNLNVNNPTPEVSIALENSGLLTKEQLAPIEEKTAVIKEQESKVKEGDNIEVKDTKSEVVNKTKEEQTFVKDDKTESKTAKRPQIVKPLTSEELTLAKSGEPTNQFKVIQDAIEPRLRGGEKIDSQYVNEIKKGEITPEEAIAAIKSAGIEVPKEITALQEKANEPKPIIGKAKIAEGFDELLQAIGGKANIAPNMFNQPSAFNALKKITEGIVEETGLQGQKLIAEVKKRLKASLGDKFQEEDIDEIAGEITDHAKSFKKTEDKVQEDKPKKEPKVEVKKEDPKKTNTEPKTKDTKKGQEEKQSGFQKRTLETAEGDSAKEQVRKVVEENQQFYKVMNIAESVEKASKKIEKEGGFDKAYERLITEKVDLNDLPVLQIERQLALDFYGRELDLAVKDGRKADSNKAYRKVEALQDAISRDATRAGQANSMLQLWKSLRPDGTVEFMNRKINEYNEKARKKKVGNEKESVGEKIDNFQEFIETLTTEQINDILESKKGKSIIDRIVAKNGPALRNELNEKLRKRKQKVDSIVSRLDSLKIGGDKLFALPPGINMLPAVWNGSIEVIKKSIQAGETMASAIDKAVLYIKENIGKDEDFGETAFRAQFAEEKKSLDSDIEVAKEIDKALIDLNENIKDVVKQHYTKKEALGRTLAEKLIEEAGIPKNEAESMSKLIQNEFKSKIEAEARKQLTKALGVTRLSQKREAKKLADDLIEKINLGAVDSDFYNTLFADKFGLAKPLTPEQAAELKRLADVVSKQESGSLFERKATIDMLKYMNNVYPKDNVIGTFFSLYYASLLSGFTTSTLNILSAGSNIITKPIRDVVNLSKWVQAARKGIESGSVKDFLAYSPFNDMFYMPTAFAHAASLGTTEFAEVWNNGDLDSKFIEQVANKDFSRINPLERDRYGKNAFKPININIGGKKISINPFNYYKYVGRALAAQDKLMFRVSNDIEMVSIIREKMLDKGLRGKELRKAVIDEYTQRNVDAVAVQEKLDKEVASYEESTGKKITKGQKKIRLREILESNLPPEYVETAENLGRSNIFTDQRGGMIADMASKIGQFSNKNSALAIALKPWVPFTTVVGNVSEYMMDTIPVYGQLRANGLSISSMIKMAGAKDINTAQMGVPESREYYEQMGRAWLGTSAALIAGALLIGTDEEDEIYITGGYAPDGFKMGRENVTPKYTLVIKGVEIPYLNIPGLAIPLALIGNYNDRLNYGDKEEELKDRLAYTTANSIATITDMSFVKGIQDLIKLISDVTSGEVSATERVGREVYKKYFLTATKPLPQNFNLVDQIEKIFDPTSYSQKDIADITAYGLGVQRFFNKPSLDVLGDARITLPGETLMPYAHWLGIKGNDERWKFLSKHNAIPNRINGNQDINFINEDLTYERRKPEPEELYDYTKLAGNKFSEKLKGYMNFEGIEERGGETVRLRGEEVSLIQKDISELWSDAKEEARYELFTK